MAKAPLMVSVSGIRGVVGDSLTPQVAMDFAASYGTPLAGKAVVVSRDGRATGGMLRDACAAGLAAVGCAVVDIGIAATPTCGYLVKSLGAAGGIQITASHNPPEWNGMKLYRPEGFVLGPSAGKKVADDYKAGRRTFVEFDRVGATSTIADPHQGHLDCVRSLVDVDSIRRRRFKIAFDCNHGSGAAFGPRLLESLGCTVEVLGGVPDGRFEHVPEPTRENLTGLCQAVRKSGADLGFAVDPDADRLAVVDGSGRYIGEEYTLALAILERTRSAKGPIVLNASTSLLSESVAKAAGCAVFRTPVGEVHVAERIIKEQALIGGEGNGGVIDPRVGHGRDSAIGMALVLNLLASESRSLAAIVDALPVFTLRKEKTPIQVDRLPTLFERLEAEFVGATIDRSDGLRFEWPDAWLQVRASNTEPIVRIFAESSDPRRADQLCQTALGLLR